MYELPGLVALDLIKEPGLVLTEQPMLSHYSHDGYAILGERAQASGLLY